MKSSRLGDVLELNVLANSHLGLLLLRLAIGGMLLPYGLAKLYNPGEIDYIAHLLSGYGLPAFLAWYAIPGQIIPALMLILGYRVRLAGILIVGMFLFIVGLAHPGDIFALNDFGGWKIDLQAFFTFGSLALVFTGAGNYAIRTSG